MALETKAKETVEVADKPRVVSAKARPIQLPGATYKVPMANGNNVYVTINDNVNDDGSKYPYELFITNKNLSTIALTSTITLLVSKLFRTFRDPSVVCDELRAVHDPNGSIIMPGIGMFASLPAAIANFLRNSLLLA